MEQINLGIPALLISFVMTMVLANSGIPILQRAKMGQPIREDGPQSHLSKSGVPTMGGIFMAIAVVVVGLLFARVANSLLVIVGTLVMGGVGFVDDYEKLTKKQSLGLDERQKLILQVAVSVFLVVFYRTFNANAGVQFLPFPPGEFDFSYFMIPVMIFVLVGTVNATNLTDGLDGLNSLVSVFVFFAYAWIAARQNQPEVAIVAFSFAGALIAFLFFNANPAKVFMGDTGSMAIGGAVAMLAIVTRTIWFLPIIGFVYVAEAASVLIQTFYFRRTGGKRIFLMSPIHHHYELKGVPEQKIVIWFSMVSLLCCLLGIWLYGVVQL